LGRGVAVQERSQVVGPVHFRDWAGVESSPGWTFEERESSMSEPQPEVVVRDPKPDERVARASLRAGDHGLPLDQEHDEEASFLLILLRALGAMYP
jgi:hypothetical protein